MGDEGWMSGKERDGRVHVAIGNSNWVFLGMRLPQKFLAVPHLTMLSLIRG